MSMSVAEALSAPHPRHVATAPRTHHALPSVMSRPALVSQNHAFPFAGHGYFDDGNPPNTSSPVMAGYAHGPNSRELRDSLIAPQVMPFRLSSQQQAADLPGASANFAQAPHHTAIPANALPAPPGPGPGPPRQHRIAATRAITAPAFKQNYHPLRLRELQLYGSGEYGRMAANGAGAADFGPSEEELAQLQKLSAEYAPEVSGPLVSERIPTSAITAEYARADPIYQTKTATLPQRYSYYRRCRGDGHCGWRAIGFCYYETLLRLGDKQKFLEEQARIRSLGNLLQAGGLPRDIYEDWEDEIMDLLKTLPTYHSLEEAEAALLTAFNETGPWQSIITYLKVLTGAWIQTHRHDYEPFIPQGQTVEDFVSRNIQASECEIEHLGLNALFDVLLKPAGFALEVMYLDRSAGAELYPHRMEAVDSTTGMALPNAPTLRLLYRPGHYDIIYSLEQFPSANTMLPQSMNGSAPNGAPHAPVFVALASPTEDGPAAGVHSTPIQQLDFVGFMPTIPGMSGISSPGINPTQSLWMSPPGAPTGAYPAGSNFDYVTQAPGLVQREYQTAHQPVQSQPPPPASAPPPLQRIATSHVEQHYAPQTPISAAGAYMTLPLPPTTADMFVTAMPTAQHHHNTSPGAVAAPSVQLGGIDRGGDLFRPSIWEYESRRWGEAAAGGFMINPRDNGFQTSIFKNSHFNTAHFNNPDFQPEEWTPGSEASNERSRRKSTAPST